MASTITYGSEYDIWGSNLSTTPRTAKAIDSNSVLVALGGVTNHTYLWVVKPSDGSYGSAADLGITVSSLISITFYDTSGSDKKFCIFYKGAAQDHIYARTGYCNGTENKTVTLNATTYELEVTANLYGLDAVALDTTHFAVSYMSASANVYSVIATESSGAITFGTPSSSIKAIEGNSLSACQIRTAKVDSTHWAITMRQTKSGTGQYHNFCVICYTADGAAVTAGTPVDFSSVNINAAPVSCYRLSVAGIDSTHIAVAYMQGSYGSPNTGAAYIATLSGANNLTLTFGTKSADYISTSADLPWMEIDKLDSTHFVIAFGDHDAPNTWTAVGLISGTDITWDVAKTALTSADDWPEPVNVTTLTSTTYAIFYFHNNRQRFRLGTYTAAAPAGGTYSGSGSATLSGSATIEYQSYIGSGSITIAGAAATLFNPIFAKTGSGTATLSGTVVIEIDRVISCSGTVTIAGAATTALSGYEYIFAASGSITLSRDNFSNYYLNLDTAFITKDNVASFGYSRYTPNSAPPAGGRHGWGPVVTCRISDTSFLYLSEYYICNSEGEQSSISIVAGIGTYTETPEPSITISPVGATAITGSDNCRVHGLYEVDTNKYIAILPVSAGASSGLAKLVIINVSGETISFGSVVTATGLYIGSNQAIAMMSTTEFILSGQDGNATGLKTLIGTISGTTITLGTLFTNNNIKGYGTSVFKLSSSTFVYSGTAGASTSNRRYCIGSYYSGTIYFGAHYEATDSTYNGAQIRFIKSTSTEILVSDIYTIGEYSFRKLTYSGDTISSHSIIDSGSLSSNAWGEIVQVSTDRWVLAYSHSINPPQRDGSPPLSGYKTSVLQFRIPSIDNVIPFTERTFSLPAEYDPLDYKVWGVTSYGCKTILKLAENKLLIPYISLDFIDYDNEWLPDTLPGELFTKESFLVKFIVVESYWNQLYTAAGTATLSGSATRAIGINCSVSGGITIGGAGSVTLHYSITSSGTITLGGTSSSTIEFVRTGSGGVSITGTAPPYLELSYSGSGGAELSGIAYYGVNLYSGSGGMELSGAAETYRDRFYTGSGSIVVGGASAVVWSQILTATVTPAPIVLSGAAGMFPEFTGTVVPVPIVVYGSAAYESGSTYFASGGITIGGSAPVAAQTRIYTYRGTSGIVISGAIGATSLTRNYLYVVKYPRGPIVIGGAASDYRTWKDYVYVPPWVKVYTGGSALYQAHYSNVYAPTGGITLGGTSTTQRNFFGRVSGGFHIGGGATWYGDRQYSGRGIIRLSGTAAAGKFLEYEYTPSGSATLGGHATCKYIPYLVPAIGGVGTLGGTAASTYTWKYAYTCSGAASLSGAGSYVIGSAHFKYLPKLVPITLGGAALYSRSIPNEYRARGGITLRYFAVYEYSRILSYSSSGKATLGGSATCRLYSKHWAYSGSGSLTLSGQAAIKLAVVSTVGGVGELGGGATYRYSKVYLSSISGRATLSGTAAKEHSKIYAYTASGTITLKSPDISVFEILAFDSKVTITLAFDSLVDTTLAIDSKVYSTLSFYSEVVRVA